ncbi:hypothetical protein B0G77_5962 [Paraburkholderia sp. BL10I2N1]|nr:hypothetical protein B0G77_5962 [Paraburkholderia sp. BL10I2N1]
MKATRLAEPLDGGHIGTVDLHREHQAALDRRPVEEHRTCPAHTVVTSDVTTRQPEVATEKVHQQQPRLNLPTPPLAVDTGFDLDLRWHVIPPELALRDRAP